MVPVPDMLHFSGSLQRMPNEPSVASYNRVNRLHLRRASVTGKATPDEEPAESPPLKPYDDLHPAHLSQSENLTWEPTLTSH